MAGREPRVRGGAAAKTRTSVAAAPVNAGSCGDLRTWPHRSQSQAVPSSFALTTVSYAARTCGRGRRPRVECTAARGCRHERPVRLSGHPTQNLAVHAQAGRAESSASPGRAGVRCRLRAPSFRDAVSQSGVRAVQPSVPERRGETPAGRAGRRPKHATPHLTEGARSGKPGRHRRGAGRRERRRHGTSRGDGGGVGVPRRRWPVVTGRRHYAAHLARQADQDGVRARANRHWTCQARGLQRPASPPPQPRST